MSPKNLFLSFIEKPGVHGKTGSSAFDRVYMIGGVIIRDVIWTGRLTHLNGLPHLLGVPHLYVNRPLNILCIGSAFHHVLRTATFCPN